MSTDIEQYIQDKVARGDFQSRDDLVETAVSMYRDLEEHQALRAELQKRLESARNGSVAPLDIASLKGTLTAEFREVDSV
ncbi:MAG: hypothetical protein O2820_15895 [Planctomycetota bacterium]|nr:hypothetical protein [Planctomycetota bacterium]MDA1250700.1 hypothetical protein [Planctomycetota bacterium]